MALSRSASSLESPLSRKAQGSLYSSDEMEHLFSLDTERCCDICGKSSQGAKQWAALSEVKPCLVSLPGSHRQSGRPTPCVSWLEFHSRAHLGGPVPFAIWSSSNKALACGRNGGIGPRALTAAPSARLSLGRVSSRFFVVFLGRPCRVYIALSSVFSGTYVDLCHGPSAAHMVAFLSCLVEAHGLTAVFAGFDQSWAASTKLVVI